MRYSWSVSTAAVAPNDLPVTVEMARTQCRIPDESQDDFLELLIGAAANYVQTAGRLFLCPQSIRVEYADGFPCGNGAIVLPYGPVRSITTVEYVAADAATSSTFTTLTGSQAWPASPRAYLLPAVGSDWPDTMPLAVPALKITYAVGFASVAAIPAALRNAVLMIVRMNFESPDGFNRSGEVQIPPVIEQFIASQSLRGYP